MSSEAKRVKILTLVELALGLALVVAGIAFVVMGAASAFPYLLCAEGVATLLFGGRGALIANVPARIGKLVSLGLIVLVAQIASSVAVALAVGTENIASDPVPVAIAAIPAVFTLAIVLLSRGMAKRAER